MRRTEFANYEYYHIYNRGVDKREVFLDERDYGRFLEGICDFNNNLNREERLRKAEKSELTSESELSSDFSAEPKLVDIICYCLNPNHYHFILKQNSDKGIEKFMHKLSTGYTNYFNKKNNRSGSLFQGRYKSIYVASNEYLLLLSTYVNANHEIHGYPEKAWAYSSYLDYIGKRDSKLCDKEIILDQFGNDFLEYEKYVQDNMLYFKDKKKMCVLE